MNLTISNLNAATTEAELRSVLEEFGPIGKISLQYLAGNLLRAYVETYSDETGEIILRYLEGDIINGRALEISRGGQNLIGESGFPDQVGQSASS